MPDYKRLSIFISFPFLATLLLMMFLHPLPGLAEIRVCPDGCDYSDLKQALNASAQDETITVCSGVYSHPVVVAKRVFLHGLDTGQGKPVLVPQEEQVVLAAYGATLRGFRFPKPEDSGRKPAQNCTLEVILPAIIFFNEFWGKGSVCPEDAASWNSSQKINYQFRSRVLRGYLGNYWDDYSGSDENGDGIGDQPVFLNEKNIDYHPLMYPVDNYRVPEEKETETELIRARVGEPFTIALPSNPTTGYTWTMDYDNVLLRAEDAEFQPSATNAVRPGAGGTSVFVFTPLRIGKTTIRLVYKRPWENIVADTRAFYVEIIS